MILDYQLEIVYAWTRVIKPFWSILPVMFTFRITPEHFTTPDDLRSLFEFLERTALVPPGSQFCWSQSPLFEVHIPPQYLLIDDADGRVDMEICFLDNDRKNVEQKLEKTPAPLLAIGHLGVPGGLDHICIPFEMGRHFRTDWLREVMELARPHKIRLLNSDHGFVANEVMKIAKWFHMDSVRHSMREWLTEDLTGKLSDLMEDFPDAEVKADVGRTSDAFKDEDPARMIIMGCLVRGLHLPHRHHGLAYGSLLCKTGASGLFIRS